ncbi:hypothetical protein KUBF_30920 [Bacteroides finegoldii]|nr:hypothetical protein KUBF_30920 [Bacteroides finegoldii]
MKSNINYMLILFLLNIFSLSGCYDDKSTFANNSIEYVTIDTTGISKLQYVGYQEQLDITPKIQPEKPGLQYQWALTDIPNSAGELEVISTEKELHYIMNRPVSAQPYYLLLTVTDTENGELQNTCIWTVYVQGTFTSGLLVADSKGETSDFTYIKNQTVSELYDKEEKIYRQILETANSMPYPGIITSMAFNNFSNKTNQVWAITSEGYCSRFNCQDFSENGNSDSESLLPFKPEGFKFISFFKAHQRFFANTNNGMYSFMPQAANIFAVPDGTVAGCNINNNIYANNTDENNASYYLVWLDKEKGSFLAYTSPGFNQYACKGYKENNAFNPNDMGNQSAIAAITTENGKQTAFCLKQDDTGTYAIYTLNNYVAAVTEWNEELGETIISPAIEATAQSKYTIPNEGKILLDQAVSVFFAKKENVLYVATQQGLYAITYGMGNTATVNSVAKFNPEADENITLAKLFQQGYYTRNLHNVVGNNASMPELPWNNKAVIVATQNSNSEGKLYVIPMTSQVGTGNLDNSKALKYDGFNKINDVITISF